LSMLFVDKIKLNMLLLVRWHSPLAVAGGQSKERTIWLK